MLPVLLNEEPFLLGLHFQISCHGILDKKIKATVEL